MPLYVKKRVPIGAPELFILAVSPSGLFLQCTLSIQSPISTPVDCSNLYHKTNFEYALPANVDSSVRISQAVPRYVVSEPSPSKRTTILSKFLQGQEPYIR